jgi:hypothetical protein
VFASLMLGALVTAWLIRNREFPSSQSPAPTRTAASVRSPAANVTGGPAPVSHHALTRDETLAALREKLGTNGTPDEIMAELATISKTDPGLAIDLAHALGRTDEEKSAWVSDLAKQWATRAPQQAWDWLAQQNQTRLRDLAAGTLPAVILGAMATSEPALLLHNIDQLVHLGETPFGVAPVVAVHLGLDALTANHLDLARQAVEAWTNDPAKPAIGEAAYLTVADALSKLAGFDEAGAWLKAMPPSTERETALVEFPAHWAESNPRAALDWVEANVPSDLQARAVQRTFGDWAERNPVEAGEWLGAYLGRTPANIDTDRLIGALVNLGPAVKESPATALHWTNLLTDPVARIASEEKIVLRWARQDRAAASDHLWKSQTLTPDRKQALIRQMAQPNFTSFDD